jgi:hypothetical protein
MGNITDCNFVDYFPQAGFLASPDKDLNLFVIKLYVKGCENVSSMFQFSKKVLVYQFCFLPNIHQVQMT